jgi:rhodanese-related sulfurtransferase
MNVRVKLSIILCCLGTMLAILPLTSGRSFNARFPVLFRTAADSNLYISADEAAVYLATEDKTVQFIDLRAQEEFSKFNIPGSVNFPYSGFLDTDPDRILNNRKLKYIFYSNGDIASSYALMIARGLGYNNTYALKGGLNDWFTTVMNTTFSGDRISARENALFENRMKARKMFTGINSLPDSLKNKFIESRHLAARKLDGGCE